MNEHLLLRDQTFADAIKGDYTGLQAYSDLLQERNLECWAEVKGVASSLVCVNWWSSSTAASRYIHRTVVEAADRVTEGCRKASVGKLSLVLAANTARIVGNSGEFRDYLMHVQTGADLFRDQHFLLYGVSPYLFGLQVTVPDQEILPGGVAIVYNSHSGSSVLIHDIR